MAKISGVEKGALRAVELENMKDVESERAEVEAMVEASEALVVTNIQVRFRLSKRTSVGAR